jgi:hypothetical protein
MSEGEGKSRKRKLLGFYIAAFATLGVFAGGVLSWPRFAAWRRERTITQQILDRLDHRTNVNFVGAPPGEVLYFCGALSGVGGSGRFGDLPDFSTKKVTLQYEDVPIGFILDSWCLQVGADWTVADARRGMVGGPNFKLCVGSPEYVRKLEEAHPAAARMVRSYRDGLKKIKAGEGEK